MLRAFKGAQADANKGQAMSPGTGATGGTRGRDPSAQFSGNNNLTKKNKDALSAQRKGARAAITPSSTTGNQIAGAVMNAIIPFSGTLYKKAIDSKAMGQQKDPLVALKERELDLKAMDLQRKTEQDMNVNEIRENEIDERLDIEKMKLENNEDQAAERIRIADEKLEIARLKKRQGK